MITIFCTNIEQGLPNISKTFYKTEQPLWMASLMHICVLNSTHISIQRKRRAKYSVSRGKWGTDKKRTVVLSRLSSSWREMLKIICYSWVRVKKCKEILQLFHIWPKHSFIVKAAFVAFPPLLSHLACESVEHYTWEFSITCRTLDVDVKSTFGFWAPEALEHNV